MSCKNRVVLEYLVANSELARSLEEVTLEELLIHQEDLNKCVWLLSKLPQLEKDNLKMSNVLLDRALPYDSLIGLSTENLVQLRELCKYFMLSDSLCKKLSVVIENGIDIEKYDFDFMFGWHKIGDVRGFKWAHKMMLIFIQDSY